MEDGLSLSDFNEGEKEEEVKQSSVKPASEAWGEPKEKKSTPDDYEVPCLVCEIKVSSGVNKPLLCPTCKEALQFTVKNRE